MKRIAIVLTIFCGFFGLTKTMGAVERSAEQLRKEITPTLDEFARHDNASVQKLLQHYKTWNNQLTTIRRNIAETASKEPASAVRLNPLDTDLSDLAKRLQTDFDDGPWNLGQKFLENFKQGTPVTGEEVSYVAWYLYKLVVDQGYSLTKILMQIPDPNNVLIDFFKACPTHYAVGKFFQDIQFFAVDIGDTTQFGLPNGMRRLLFGHSNGDGKITYVLFQEYESGFATLIKRALLFVKELVTGTFGLGEKIDLKAVPELRNPADSGDDNDDYVHVNKTAPTTIDDEYEVVEYED